MQFYYAICFFILGSVIASFIDLLATRLPLNRSIIKPKSHCEKCNHQLKWYELIPILSYIIQKGKCRVCKQKISLDTICSEIILAIIYCLCFLKYGFTYELIYSLILSTLVLVIFITDIKYMLILDSPLIISSIIIIITKYFEGGLENLFLSLISGIFLFLLMLIVGYLGKKVFKREALGGGDIKLAFIIGLLLNIPLGLTALVLSTFLALPYATYSLITNSTHEVAYGPFLISATLIVFLYSSKFLLLIDLLFPYR